ncbi:hypothetical protein HL13_gp72 [Dinoroseobacter phage DFL12phi1]|uniref:Uncharacterized protein n=1 Tax=Dinoroseobacter phage DFL12phi1 TaxID=1477404 RepID=A0A023NGG5_9CAUD|nr:hypothetical protein HL13_gp72 [Dinoroseobacter phage DFL12phi1]AHX01032.1 hypothetical protein DFL12P1_0072 [Dinoroseobacter phage DFL12phi1]
MAAETAHLTGCGPDETPKTKREKLKEWQKNYDALGFSKFLCGDEAIVSVQEDGKIEVKVRKQTSMDESRNFRFVFDTQTQCERLIGPILKGLTK